MSSPQKLLALLQYIQNFFCLFSPISGTSQEKAFNLEHHRRAHAANESEVPHRKSCSLVHVPGGGPKGSTFALQGLSCFLGSKSGSRHPSLHREQARRGSEGNTDRPESSSSAEDTVPNFYSLSKSRSGPLLQPLTHFSQLVTQHL